MRVIRDRNVAVIGGAGFLGSHAVDHLINDRQCNVWVVDNLCAGRREFVHNKAHFIHADITHSVDYLRDVFTSNKIKFVLNYAAHPYIPDSFARPTHVTMTNFFGAMNVINAAQDAGCERILQISSAEIYGTGYPMENFDNPEHVSLELAEDCPVIPCSSYGVSKAAVDAMVQVRWMEAKTPCIALRQFNCIGSRETHPYIVPEIISQLTKYVRARKEKPTAIDISSIPVRVKLGNNSTRDFLYAGDQAKIAVELLENGKFGEVYNLGSELSIKMYDLAKLIGKLMGFSNVIVEEDESRKRPWEIWHLQSDNTKIYSVVKSRPQVTLEEGLKRTIAYYEENGRKWCWE